MRLALCSCNPACQERRSITHALLPTAVPLSFVTAGCKPAQRECHTKSTNLRAALTMWKPSVFSGNMAPFVVEVGCLFPRLRASLWTKKAHENVARARLHEKIVKIWGVRRSHACFHLWIHASRTVTLLYCSHIRTAFACYVVDMMITWWHDDDHLMTWWKDCPWTFVTFVRTSEVFELNFLWKVTI